MMQPSLPAMPDLAGTWITARPRLPRLSGGDADIACEALFAKAASLGILDAEHHAVVARAVREVIPLASGRALRTPPHDDSRVYVMVEGWAYRSATTCDGGRQITDILLPGDIIVGNVGDADSPDPDVTACGPARIALLRHDASGDRGTPLRALIDEARAEETAILRARLVSLGRRSASSRLAHLFAELLSRLTRVGLADKGMFHCPMTQEHLGDVLGLTAVHINRTLQGLRRDGLVTFDRPVIVIKDPLRLRGVAGIHQSYLQ